MTIAAEMIAIERLKSAGTSVIHNFDEEGTELTIESQLQLAPGIELHYFDTDDSSALCLTGTSGELEFIMNDRLADMFLRLDSLSAAEFFAELGKARI